MERTWIYSNEEGGRTKIMRARARVSSSLVSGRENDLRTALGRARRTLARSTGPQKSEKVSLLPSSLVIWVHQGRKEGRQEKGKQEEGRRGLFGAGRRAPCTPKRKKEKKREFGLVCPA